MFQTALKGQVQVEVQLQEKVMKTFDSLKERSNDTVGVYLVSGRWNILLNVCSPSWNFSHLNWGW